MSIRIVDPSNFTKNQNRRHTETKWWACPARRSRKCEALIGQHPKGLAIYGFWCVLIGELANRSTPWAMVTGDGKPESLDDLAWRLRVAPEFASEAATELVRIGWLEWLEPRPPVANTEAASEGAPETQDRTGHYITGQDRTIQMAVAAQPTPSKAGGVEWFKSFWNDHAAKTLPAIQSFGPERQRALTGLLRRAGGNREAVERAAAAFASWPFAIEKRLNVDTFLRACNRDKYLEWGQTGPPNSNGSVAAKADAAIVDYAKRRFKDAGNLDDTR